MVDVADSKSAAGDSVPVRVRSPAPKYLPLFDTMVSARVGIFISIFTPEQGEFLNFATHFGFRCPPVVLLPGVSGLPKCNILRFQFVKQPQFVIQLGIRYTTETTKFTQGYLVNLATCNTRAAEVTSHPHLGGDDNATTIGTAETMR